MNILLNTWSILGAQKILISGVRSSPLYWGLTRAILGSWGDTLSLQQEDYTTDEDMVEGVEGKLGNGSGAGGILDLLKASRQVGGPDYAALTWVLAFISPFQAIRQQPPLPPKVPGQPISRYL